jgi:hypothetical protein
LRQGAAIYPLKLYWSGVVEFILFSSFLSCLLFGFFRCFSLMKNVSLASKQIF